MNLRELDVLNILWKSEKPMMATDIVNAKDGLTQSTVTAVLRKMLKENLVEVTGVTHSGRVLSRTYRPTERSKEVIFGYFMDSYKEFSDIINPSSLCFAILTSNSSEKKNSEIKKVLEFISKYEANLE